MPADPRLGVDRSTYRYGQTVQLGVIATGSVGEAVTVSTIATDGTRRVVRAGTIDSRGRFRATLRATGRTRLVAQVVHAGSSHTIGYSVSATVTQRRHRQLSA